MKNNKKIINIVIFYLFDVVKRRHAPYRLDDVDILTFNILILCRYKNESLHEFCHVLSNYFVYYFIFVVFVINLLNNLKICEKKVFLELWQTAIYQMFS